MKSGKGRKLFYYQVTRIVKEQYEVLAYSIEDAKFKTENPHTITVLKESVKKSKTDNNEMDKSN